MRPIHRWVGWLCVHGIQAHIIRNNLDPAELPLLFRIRRVHDPPGHSLEGVEIVNRAEAKGDRFTVTAPFLNFEMAISSTKPF
mgnify:CR=1 FL=1